jgi:hypothetical protein
LPRREVAPEGGCLGGRLPRREVAPEGGCPGGRLPGREVALSKLGIGKLEKSLDQQQITPVVDKILCMKNGGNQHGQWFWT